MRAARQSGRLKEHAKGLPVEALFASTGTADTSLLEKAIQQTGRVNPHAAMRFANEICAGVAAAHAAGVIHGDLKPANVMVAHHAKVMDFGIAYLINEAPEQGG